MNYFVLYTVLLIVFELYNVCLAELSVDFCRNTVKTWPEYLKMMNRGPTKAVLKQSIKKTVIDINDCMKQCCKKKNKCEAIFYYSDVCYLLSAKNTKRMKVIDYYNNEMLLISKSALADKLNNQLHQKHRKSPGAQTIFLDGTNQDQIFDVYVLPSAILLLDASDVVIETTIFSEQYGEVKEKIQPNIWFWIRSFKGLAVGTITNINISQPVLTMMDLIPGRYDFELIAARDFYAQVFIVRVNVMWDPLVSTMIKLHLEMSINNYTVDLELTTVLNLTSLLLDNKPNNDLMIFVDDVQEDYFNGNVMVLFHVEYFNQTNFWENSVKSIIKSLKKGLQKQPLIAGHPVTKVTSMLCMHDCGKNGYCHQTTHDCVCNPGYMLDPIMKLRTGDPNCDLKRVTAGLIVGCVFAALFGLIALCCMCRLRKRFCKNSFNNSSNPVQYALLDDPPSSSSSGPRNANRNRSNKTFMYD